MIVGFGHKARSGKDTAARELHSLLPKDSKIYSFADALKAWARVSGLMKAKDGPLLQTLGTDVFRRVNPDIWVEVMKSQVEEDGYPLAIIADMRFPNEAEWISSSGGLTIDIQRYNDASLTDRYFSPDRDPAHYSEVALDDYKFDLVCKARTGDLSRITNFVFDELLWRVK